MVIGGVLVSAALLWLVSREPVVALTYTGGVGCLAAALFFALRLRGEPDTPEFAAPDWSVTHAAIDRGTHAMAIIDRAGRLACANARFAECFGIAAAPPRLGLETAQREEVETAARAAWRDGRAVVEPIDAGGVQWRLEIDRAGRGEDFLVWRFEPVVRRDPLAEAVGHLNGKVGRALAL
jgi:two-component system cell cycle sensor histidine kinase/response regulator CckA